MRSKFQFDNTEAALTKMIQGVLARLRTSLDMDVCFVSEFVKGRRVFKHVDGEAKGVIQGASGPLSDSFCRHIVDGRMPAAMPDASCDPIAGSMKVTLDIPIGAHVSVPIKLSTGALYGTLCCFSRTPRDEISSRDVALLEISADFVAALLEANGAKQSDYLNTERSIKSVLAERAIQIVYQPIFRLKDQRVAGFEALSRFASMPVRSPDVWFAEADSVGLGTDLEFLAVEEAMAGFLRLPQPSSISLNLSPASIVSDRFAALFGALPLNRVVVEVTEHAAIDSYTQLHDALAGFRRRGLKLAIDDVGAGYSSFRHVLDLAPDFIKLDVSLTRHIDGDLGRQALTKAIALYGRQMGCEIVAEGVETEEELATLAEAGVTKIQGHLIARPLPLSAARDLCLTGRPGKKSTPLSPERKMA